MEFDDILKYVNDLAKTMDVEQTLLDGKNVYLILSRSPALPADIAQMLSMANTVFAPEAPPKTPGAQSP